MVPTGQKQNAASKRKEGMDIISGVEIGDPKKIGRFSLGCYFSAISEFALPETVKDAEFHFRTPDRGRLHQPQ